MADLIITLQADIIHPALARCEAFDMLLQSVLTAILGLTGVADIRTILN